MELQKKISTRTVITTITITFVLALTVLLLTIVLGAGEGIINFTPSSITSTTNGTIIHTVSVGNGYKIHNDGAISMVTNGSVSASMGISGEGNSRTITLSNIQGNGTIRINIGYDFAITDDDSEYGPNLGTITNSTVTVDNTAPTGSIGINGGALYVNSRNVLLNLSASDDSTGIAAMRISNDGINWGSEESYVATKSYTLPEGDGQKTVCVQYKDGVGNWSEIYSAKITLDSVAPTITKASIKSTNASKGYAKVGDTVTLTFVASEKIYSPAVKILSRTVPAIEGSDNTWTATYTLTSADQTSKSDVLITFEISNYKDIISNVGQKVTATTDGTTVTFYRGEYLSLAIISIAKAEDGKSVTFTVSSKEEDKDRIEENKTTYSILKNGESYANGIYKGPVTLTGKGTYIVMVTQYDKSGNSRTTTESIVITDGKAYIVNKEDEANPENGETVELDNLEAEENIAVEENNTVLGNEAESENANGVIPAKKKSTTLAIAMIFAGILSIAGGTILLRSNRMIEEEENLDEGEISEDENELKLDNQDLAEGEADFSDEFSENETTDELDDTINEGDSEAVILSNEILSSAEENEIENNENSKEKEEISEEAKEKQEDTEETQDENIGEKENEEPLEEPIPEEPKVKKSKGKGKRKKNK